MNTLKLDLKEDITSKQDATLIQKQKMLKIKP